MARVDVRRRDAAVVSRAVHAVVALGWRVRPSRRLATALARRRRDRRCPRSSASAFRILKSREARGERGRQEVLGRQRAAVRLRQRAHPPGAPTSGSPARGPSRRARAVPRHVDAGAGRHRDDAAAHGRRHRDHRRRARSTFDWSLGFKGLTYDDLYKRSVVHRGMRVPARFSVVVGAALALLAAFGARRLLRLGRTPAARAALRGAHPGRALRLAPGPAAAGLPRRRSRRSTSRVTPDMVLVELPRRARRSTSCTSRPATGPGCSAATAASSGLLGDADGRLEGVSLAGGDRRVPARRRHAPDLQLRARRETESLRRGVGVSGRTSRPGAGRQRALGAGTTSASIASNSASTVSVSRKPLRRLRLERRTASTVAAEARQKDSA